MVVRKGLKVPHKKNRASAMVASMVFIAVAAMAVGSVVRASNNQTRNTYRSRIYNTSLAAAATSLNSMAQQAYFVATTRPAQLQGNFANLNNALLAIKPQKNPGFVSVKSASGKDLTTLKATGANDGSYEVINDPKDDWNGFNIQRWKYDIVAFMNEGNEATGAVDTNAQRLGFRGAGFTANLEINFIPLYQYAIFYDNDLEIHNGPNLDVRGPVHTNRTLWVAAGSGSTTKFHDRVSAAGNFRNYKDFTGVDGSAIARINVKNADLEETAGDKHTGNVQIKKLNGNFENMRMTTSLDSNKNGMLDALDNNWMTNALGRYDSRLQDSAMGIKPIKPPLPYVDKPDGDRAQADAGELIQRIQPGDSESMKAAKMESKADIIIEGSPASSVFDNNTKEWTNITLKNPKTGATIPNTVYNATTKKYESLVTPAYFYDARQKKNVNAFDINMGMVDSRKGSLPLYSGNGLLYASPTAAAGNLPAVRLTNASKMPSSLSRTMTVATDKPMYLAGNVNSTDKKTLLLAADAMTIISEGQDLSKFSPTNYSKQKAKGQTITNAIFMLGQVSSKYDNDEGSYADGLQRKSMSGGAHNVLRYLENWSGVEHQFNGSLICLFESRLATAAFWKNGGAPYYDAPTRNYNWDASLKNAVPPAGMPVLVQVITGTMNRIGIDKAIAKVGN